MLALLLLLLPPALAEVRHLKDPVTGRAIVWHRSAQHETHHYYDISPWDPSEQRILFFRFDAAVVQRTATGRYPGSLWIRNVDGSGERQIAGGVEGNYHTGANQFWGPDGGTVYYSAGAGGDRATYVVDVASGKKGRIATPAPASKISPDFKTISCVRGSEWGLYEIADGKYERLATLERAIALSPNKHLVRDTPSSLQNTRFNPQGGQVLIVHRTNDDFPRLVEMFVYTIATGQMKFLADEMHHPNWRPDGKAILYVHPERPDYFQTLMEVDVQTGKKTRLTREHVPAGHPSYHPTKPHWIVTDCYGGPMGNGLALIDTRSGEMKQLVTIPLGAQAAKPADARFPFRNWGLWIPQREFLNEPRPVWNKDGTKVLFTSEESGRQNLYVVDTSDLR
ncbi:MAG: PD40 domain-containing protein [Bryobacterales bacterium]|nr:PD40 domain-containing protein [Bryobacterales bacterium]